MPCIWLTSNINCSCHWGLQWGHNRAGCSWVNIVLLLWMVVKSSRFLLCSYSLGVNKHRSQYSRIRKMQKYMLKWWNSSWRVSRAPWGHWVTHRGSGCSHQVAGPRDAKITALQIPLISLRLICLGSSVCQVLCWGGEWTLFAMGIQVGEKKKITVFK